VGPRARSGRGSEEKNSQPLPGLEPPITQVAAQRYITALSRLLNRYELILNSFDTRQNPSSSFGDEASGRTDRHNLTIIRSFNALWTKNAHKIHAATRTCAYNWDIIFFWFAKCIDYIACQY
jgi:hypothetical protein